MYQSPLEKEPRQGAEIEQLLQEIRVAAESEHGTCPWNGFRRSRRMFEIFETFPSYAARATHLADRGGRMLLARSPVLLARPPSIVLLGVLPASQLIRSAHAGCSTAAEIVVTRPFEATRRTCCVILHHPANQYAEAFHARPQRHR